MYAALRTIRAIILKLLLFVVIVREKNSGGPRIVVGDTMDKKVLTFFDLNPVCLSRPSDYLFHFWNRGALQILVRLRLLLLRFLLTQCRLLVNILLPFFTSKQISTSITKLDYKEFGAPLIKISFFGPLYSP